MDHHTTDRPTTRDSTDSAGSKGLDNSSNDTLSKEKSVWSGGEDIGIPFAQEVASSLQ